MRHLLKKLLPSVVVALTVCRCPPARRHTRSIARSSCACLAAGLLPSLAHERAPNSSDALRLGQWNPRCKSGAVPWARPLRPLQHQTVQTASLKRSSRTTALDRDNPFQRAIPLIQLWPLGAFQKHLVTSFLPTRPFGSFKIARTSISADLSSTSYDPSESSMSGMRDSMNPDVTAIATVAPPWYSAHTEPKVISPGRGLPSASYPPPISASNAGARTAPVSITVLSSSTGVTMKKTTALSR